MTQLAAGTHGYASVNGLKMYYEVEGRGEPLICIPPAFGHAGVKSFPALARCRTVITVDLQGHGRTADIVERPISFEQHVSDVVTLMQHLEIAKADVLGESFGGVIATLLAIRHPELVRRVATWGATFGPAPEAVRHDILNAKHAPTPDAIGIAFQRELYQRVAPDPAYWPTIWSKVFSNAWNGFTQEQLASIKVPLLIALGDHDFVRLEHAMDAFRRIPNAELAIIPDASHFALFHDQERIQPLICHFLEKPDSKLPFADADTGYQPGKNR